MSYNSGNSRTPNIRKGNVRQNIRARKGQFRYEDGSPYTGTRIHMHDGKYMEGAYHTDTAHRYLYQTTDSNSTMRRRRFRRRKPTRGPRRGY